MVGSDQEARAPGGLRATRICRGQRRSAPTDAGSCGDPDRLGAVTLRVPRAFPISHAMIDQDGAPVYDAPVRISTIGASTGRQARMLRRCWNWPKASAGVKMDKCATYQAQDMGGTL